MLAPPISGDDWVAVGAEPLPLAEVAPWCVLASCGAVVTFTGTSRDHAVGAGGERRDGVTVLEYEAYEEHVVARMAAVAAEARRRWPVLGRIVVWHRLGEVPVGEASVVVAVSSPHRAEAFAAASWGIDAVKATVPIWKRERWSGGTDHGLDAHPLDDLASFDGGPATAGLAGAPGPATSGSSTPAAATTDDRSPSEDRVGSCRT